MLFGLFCACLISGFIPSFESGPVAGFGNWSGTRHDLSNGSRLDNGNPSLQISILSFHKETEKVYH